MAKYDLSGIPDAKAEEKPKYDLSGIPDANSPISQTETAVRHGLNGITLGGEPMLAAGLDTAGEAAHSLFHSLGLSGPSKIQADALLKAQGNQDANLTPTIGDFYHHLKAAEIARNEEARKQNPWTAGAAELAGGIVPGIAAGAIVGPAAGLAGLSAEGAGALAGAGIEATAPVATTGQIAANLAKTGALMGSAGGLIGGEREGLGGAIEDTVKGGVAGAALGPALIGVGKGIAGAGKFAANTKAGQNIANTLAAVTGPARAKITGAAGMQESKDAILAAVQNLGLSLKDLLGDEGAHIGAIKKELEEKGINLDNSEILSHLNAALEELPNSNHFGKDVDISKIAHVRDASQRGAPIMQEVPGTPSSVDVMEKKAAALRQLNPALRTNVRNGIDDIGNRNTILEKVLDENTGAGERMGNVVAEDADGAQQFKSVRKPYKQPTEAEAGIPASVDKNDKVIDATLSAKDKLEKEAERMNAAQHFDPKGWAEKGSPVYHVEDKTVDGKTWHQIIETKLEPIEQPQLQLNPEQNFNSSFTSQSIPAYDGTPATQKLGYDPGAHNTTMPYNDLNDVSAMLRELSPVLNPNSPITTPAGKTAVINAGRAAQKLKDGIDEGLTGSNKKYRILKQAEDDLKLGDNGGIRTNAVSGEKEVEPDVVDRLINMTKNQENIGNENRLKGAFAAIKAVSPEVGSKLENQVSDAARNMDLSTKANKTGIGGHNGISDLFSNTIEGTTVHVTAAAGKAYNYMGDIADKVSKMAPDEVNAMAARIASAGTDVSKNLAKAVLGLNGKSPAARNSLLYAMSQNPAYRLILGKATGTNLDNK